MSQTAPQAQNVSFAQDVFKDPRKTDNDPKSPASPSFTNPSTVVDEDDEDLDDVDHAQDWSKTTDPKDSWAERERRRSSVWQQLKLQPQTGFKKDSRSGSSGSGGGAAPRLNVPKSPTSPNNPKDARRGSILSLWQPGRDKSGKHVLSSGHDSDDEWE